MKVIDDKEALCCIKCRQVIGFCEIEMIKKENE